MLFLKLIALLFMISNTTKSICCLHKKIIYTVDFDHLAKQNVKRFAYFEDSSRLWHHRFGHASMELIIHLSQNQRVRGLPKLKFRKISPTRCMLNGKTN